MIYNQRKNIFYLTMEDHVLHCVLNLFFILKLTLNLNYVSSQNILNHSNMYLNICFSLYKRMWEIWGIVFLKIQVWCLFFSFNHQCYKIKPPYLPFLRVELRKGSHLKCKPFFKNEVGLYTIIHGNFGNFRKQKLNYKSQLVSIFVIRIILN